MLKKQYFENEAVVFYPIIRKNGDRYMTIVDFDIYDKHFRERKISLCVRNNKTGRVYAQVSHNGKPIKLHKFIMGDPPPGMITDHKNGINLDNRRSNLRFIPLSDNSKNLHKDKLKGNKIRGMLGVIFNNKTEKWEASVRHSNKMIKIGSFKNKEDAINARKTAEYLYFQK